MKSEQEVMTKFENVVSEFEKRSAEIKEGEELTDGQKGALVAGFAILGILSWVLDIEEQFRPVLAGIKLAGAVENLKKMGV